MFEEQMNQEIISFLQEEGYVPIMQLPFFMGSIDFVGRKKDECLVIESKVSKWRKALRQALRYGYGAEKSYVALPDHTARAISKKHANTFTRYGVGLIEVAHDTNILIECKPKTPSFFFKKRILQEIQVRERKSRERINVFTRRYK